MANTSAKFDEEAHNGLVSIMFTSLFLYVLIVTLTFDLWSPKSIGSILSLWLTCLPSLMKKHITVKSLSCSQAYLCVNFDLDLWPLTSKINRVHPLVIVNMSAKFDEDMHNNLVAIVFTRIRRDAHMDGRTEGHTDGTTAALLYPLRNALRGDNKYGYYKYFPISLDFLCPRHKMARGHLVFALSILLSFHPSVPSKFVFSTPPTSLHGFEWNFVGMLGQKSRSACGEIIHVLQIFAELWSLTLRIFTHFSLSSQLLLHPCMELNETWQGGCTTSLVVHMGR